MQGKVELSSVNTSKLKVLKNDEINELLKRCKEGDKKAREELISGNLRRAFRYTEVLGREKMPTTFSRWDALVLSRR